GFNKLRPGAIFAEHFSQDRHADSDVVLFHNRIRPNPFHQVFLDDQLTTHFHEEKQQIQNFAFERNGLAAIQKTALSSFQTKIAELIDLGSNVSLHKQTRVRSD